MGNQPAPRSPSVSSADDRRWAILQQVQEQQRVSVAALSRHFGISEVSIRRDLELLEKMGLLQRVHGGAQALPRASKTALFDARRLQRAEVKQAIGQAAVALIRPGDTIFLDSGTTVLEVARHIPQSVIDEGGLTVVTRSLVIASELRGQRQVRLIVLGGVYEHDLDTFVGSQVETALRGLHVNTLFIGTDGVVADRGLTADNVLEAGLYPLMAQCADRVVVVTDSGKIGVNQLQTLLSFDTIHVFVTDAGAPSEFVAMLTERGIEVVLVTVGQEGEK
jgi:DeoR family fructose operon transcriptional repressor